MNRGNYTGRAQQNVPASTYGLEFIQQQILLAAEVARMAGYNCILSGCKESGNTVAPGVLIINGEILPFLGGTKQAQVRIVQNMESVTAAAETYDQLYVHRRVEFGENLNGIDTFDWADIVPLLTSGYIKNNAVFNTRKINGKTLASDISLTLADISPIATEKTLITPSVSMKNNNLYWYIDALGDFVLNGYIELTSIPSVATTICSLPLSMDGEGSRIFHFRPGNYSPTNDIDAYIFVWHQTNAAGLQIRGSADVRFNFNYRMPVLREIVNNGVKKYVV